MEILTEYQQKLSPSSTKAIELDPEYSLVQYNNRGSRSRREDLKEYQQVSLPRLTEAIELSPGTLAAIL